MLKRYFGDSAFNRQVVAVALPIIIQNAITNFVSLLDNIMVGQVGTLQMSGVSIVNNLIFVFNLCILGGCAGAGIFIAQYHGSGDHKNIRYIFRYKILMGLLLGTLGTVLFYFAANPLISLYLKGDGDPAEVPQILSYGREYLMVMLWGLLPFAISTAYSSTLRECGQTMVPMLAGVAAVFVNLLFNYVLIFGHLGFPAMGVRGAAIATVISRYTELAIITVWGHTHTAAVPFLRGAFRSLYIPRELARRVTVKGMPMLLNETMWSAGEATILQLYSTRGLDVVPATNITSTIFNLSSVVVMSMGVAVGIIMGQLQGAGTSKEDLWNANRKLTAMTVGAGIVFGAVLAGISGLFPMLYNTTDSVRQLSTTMILICGIFLPFVGYIHAIYFTMRSGGKTWITFFFDGGYSWLFIIPIAAILCYLVDAPILVVYIFCRGAAYPIKCVIGHLIMKKGTWIQNLAA